MAPHFPPTVRNSLKCVPVMKSKYYYFEILFEIQETATELNFDSVIFLHVSALNGSFGKLKWDVFIFFLWTDSHNFLHSLYQTRHLIYVYNISLYEPKLLNCVRFWSNEEKRYHRLFKTKPTSTWQVVCLVFRRGFHSSCVVLVSRWLLFLHVIRDWGPEALIGARWGRLFQDSLFFFYVKFPYFSTLANIVHVWLCASTLKSTAFSRSHWTKALLTTKYFLSKLLLNISSFGK